ncbi:hypothetical protein DPMN_047931 [Dreissena polymorpha]|uniref:Uncharacterized protein n=1 Tax=Dreissena polymorpha TaxID=45954 RepID=A0A9D4D8L9_DREPO|nr:hypothetical protein DPMN_047931 [Dreissena polymorpha]
MLPAAPKCAQPEVVANEQPMAQESAKSAVPKTGKPTELKPAQPARRRSSSQKKRQMKRDAPPGEPKVTQPVERLPSQSETEMDRDDNEDGNMNTDSRG